MSTITPKLNMPSRVQLARNCIREFSSGAAHAVFDGKILVHKDAQKTDARQTNKNLLNSLNMP